MTYNNVEISIEDLHNTNNYEIDSLESEIRADQYCKQLLKRFHLWLLNDQNKEALAAGRLAAGADYFLREFMVGARRQNIFSATEEQLRQFGGNWYIVNNLEPNIPELEPMLEGAALFYCYSVSLGLFAEDEALDISSTAENIDYYRNRIEDFHQLKDDGYCAWNQACALK